MRMDKCPTLVFATRHPIKAWEEIQNNKDLIPDLDEIIVRGNKSKAKAPFANTTTTNTGEQIQNGNSLYYAKYIIDGQVKEIVSTFGEAKSGGKNFDLEPILFYVLRGPIIDHTTLPAIDNEAVFYRSQLDNEFLRFSVVNANLDSEEILKISVPDNEFNEQFDKLENFD